jgi:hypothetical protein
MEGIVFPEALMSARPPQTGKINDPFFLFMLAAVLLALGSSFMLRAAVSGFSPPAAHASAADAHQNPLRNAPEDGQ